MDDKDLDNPDPSTTKKASRPHQPSSDVTTTKGPKDERSTKPKKDNDGDEYEPEKSWRFSGSYPPSWTSSEKMSKETAEYKQGMPFANCGKCTYYQSNHCKVVAGYIVQSMVCKYFAEKYTPMMSISILKRR
jgi:hypothetical protein